MASGSTHSPVSAKGFVGQSGNQGSPSDKALDNGDVIAMIAAGVGESTVIAAIEHTPRENLDVQGSALAKLKKACIGQAVIDAMVKRTTQRSKTTAASQPPVQAPEKMRRKVLVAGVCTAPYLQTVLDDLTDFLVGQKVSAKQLGGEPTSRTGYLERVASAGGDSLLYTTLDMGPGQPKLSLKAQCFEPEGKLLWEEEVKILAISGGSGAATSLLKKLEKALESRIGKPGLLVADAAPK